MQFPLSLSLSSLVVFHHASYYLYLVISLLRVSLLLCATYSTCSSPNYFLPFAILISSTLPIICCPSLCVTNSRNPFSSPSSFVSPSLAVSVVCLTHALPLVRLAMAPKLCPSMRAPPLRPAAPAVPTVSSATSYGAKATEAAPRRSASFCALPMHLSH